MYAFSVSVRASKAVRMNILVHIHISHECISFVCCRIFTGPNLKNCNTCYWCKRHVLIFFLFTGFRERSCKNSDNLNFRKLEIILKVSGMYLLFSNAAELFSTAVF